MDIPKYIHSKNEEKNLPLTLAARVSFIRNARRIHIEELAVKSRVSLKFIQDIEAGIETWLPVAVRQRIASNLKVDPKILEEVEIRKDYDTELEKAPPLELIERIKESIMSGEKNLSCPCCHKPLKVWLQEGFDINGMPIHSPKGHCTVCPFQIKS